MKKHLLSLALLLSGIYTNAQTAIDNDPANDIEFYRDTLSLPGVDSLYFNSARLVSTADIDWYKLQITNGGVIEAWCEPDSAFGLSIAVFDFEVFQLYPTYYMGTAQSATAGSTPHLKIQLCAGDYRFKISKSTAVTGFGSYQLKIILHTLLDYDECNDDESTATLVPFDTCFGARIQGIHLNDDLFLGTKCGTHAAKHQDFDWYKINVNIDSTDTMIYNVTIATPIPANQNLVIGHKKEGGTMSYHDLNSYGAGETWTLNLDSGTHYFRIHEYYSWYPNCVTIDPYDLSDSAYQICFDYRGLIGIDENTNPHSFSISPNPTTSTFTIRTATQLKNAQVEIYNLLGEKMYTAAYREQLTVNCELFQKGIYFVKVADREKQYVQKLIIQY